MVIVKLQGGLGNQMFQYAAGKSLAEHNKTSLKLDHYFLEDRSESLSHVFRDFDLDIFTLKSDRAATHEIKRFFRPNGFIHQLATRIGFAKVYEVIIEKQYHFDPSVFHKRANFYLDGFWQSEQYFQHIKNQIRADFEFRSPLYNCSALLMKQLADKELICVNVRRGDFLNNDFHPVCGMSYFIPAIEYMNLKIPNPHFLVFSDDKSWCELAFSGINNTTIIGPEHDGEKYANKLHFMSCCKHFIISNSSFAWWAVWLANRQDNIVVAPKNWTSDPKIDTRDLIPASWIKLEN